MEADPPKFKTIEEEMEYYKRQQRAISEKRAAEREKFGMYIRAPAWACLSPALVTLIFNFTVGWISNRI